MRPEISRTLVITIVATAAIIIVGYGLLLVSPKNPYAPPPNTIDILLPSSLVVPQPKPRDRFIFFGLVMALPLCLGGIFHMVRRMRLTAVNPIPIFGIVLILTGLVAATKGAFGTILTHMTGNVKTISLAWLAATLALIVALSRRPGRYAPVFFGLAICLAGVTVLGLRVWTEHNVYYNSWFTSHGEAVLFPILRIALGDTCLVEALPQYGCYGEFLAPVLGALGPSVLSMTAVLAVLQVVAVTSVIFFARSIIQSPGLLIASVLSLFVAVVLNPRPDNPDPILQYYPIRFIFPALSILLVGWLQDRPHMLRAFAAGAFGGMAIAWNLERGLAVLIALTIFAALTGFGVQSVSNWSSMKSQLLKAIAALVGAGAFLSLFVLYLDVKSSTHPNLANYFVYQTTFYFTGFGMILIPPFPDYWAMHAAIIFAVLLYIVLVVACEAPVDKDLERAAYLAVLAIGLTLYYSGRSHWLVLKLVAWPDAVLFFFLADRAMRKSIKPAKLNKTALLGQTLAVGVTAIYLTLQIPVVWRIATVSRTTATLNKQFEEDLGFVSTHTLKGERVVIFAYEQSTLYAHTGTRPALPGPSVAEMIRKVDLADLQKAMVERGPQKMFIGTGLDTASRDGMLGTDLALDFRALSSVYALAAWGPGKRIMALRRKPFDGLDLFVAGQP